MRKGTTISVFLKGILIKEVPNKLYQKVKKIRKHLEIKYCNM